jgi:hypothetical protein
MDAENAGEAVVEGRDLTGWGVLQGGTHIGLAIGATDGTTHRIVLSFDALSGLLMTLPRILQSALDVRFPDGSLRAVQQLARWKLEQKANNSGLMLSLATKDGFDVAFAVSTQDAGSLSARLLSAPQDLESPMAVRPN